MSRRWTAARALLLLALVVASGCGDDKATVLQQTADRSQYCGTAQRFAEAASAAGVVLPPPAGTEIVPASVKTLVDQIGAGIDDLGKQAPGEVRSDVRTVVAAVRKARAGDVSELRSPAFARSWRNVAAFGARVCAATGSSTDDG